MSEFFPHKTSDNKSHFSYNEEDDGDWGSWIKDLKAATNLAQILSGQVPAQQGRVDAS